VGVCSISILQHPPPMRRSILLPATSPPPSPAELPRVFFFQTIRASPLKIFSPSPSCRFLCRTVAPSAPLPPFFPPLFARRAAFKADMHRGLCALHISPLMQVFVLSPPTPRSTFFSGTVDRNCWLLNRSWFAFRRRTPTQPPNPQQPKPETYSPVDLVLRLFPHHRQSWRELFSPNCWN